MRIGIDAQIATTSIRAGLFNHVRNIARELDRLVPGSVTCLIKELRKHGASGSIPDDVRELFGGLPFRRWSPPPRFYRLWVRYGQLSRFDVLWHNLFSCLPPNPRCANVFLIPDLIPLAVDYGGMAREDHLEYCLQATKYADLIVVFSEHTRHDVISQLNVPPSNVRVIPLAAASDFFPAPPEAVAVARERHQLSDAPYVLCTSTIEVRKNHATLVRAFARLIAQEPNLPHRLVFAGGK